VSKRWRLSICFVVVPLAAPSLLLLPLPIDLSGDAVQLETVGVVAVAAIASASIVYRPRRNGWEAVLYGFVTAVLSVPALFLWLVTVIAIACWGQDRCLS
jgi:hypothetical protein